MKQQLRITKALLLKALREEPLLSAGTWVSTVDETRLLGGFTIREKESCKVCAVGAVLRAVLAPDMDANVINRLANLNARGACGANDYRSTEDILEAGGRVLRMDDPWSALSHVFESLWTYYSAKGVPREHLREAVRPQLIKFAELELPDDIEFLAYEGVEFTEVVKLMGTV